MSKFEAERAALESQVKALTDLLEVARAVVSTLDLDTVLQAILKSAMRFAQMPAGSIALYDSLTIELSLHAHAGLTADFVKKERWEVAPGGLTDEVLKAGEIFFVEDAEKAQFFKNPIALKEGIKSLICIPLVLREKIVGILYLDDFIPRCFDREKMKLLSILASFAAMAIDNAKLHNHTKIMAITDALTGLYNHRHFQQIFTQELERARRYKKPLSIIMLDVDDFKKFNDKFGHPKGDIVLASVGETISKTLRSIDSCFRYGGEEFTILLPETDLANTSMVADRLRENIERETLLALREAAGQGVTVSVGVASYPDDGATRDELLKTVDDLLYLAKEKGKNRVYSREGSATPCLPQAEPHIS